jgi:hypothetical protein
VPYCSACGVEVDADVTECPLCGKPIQGADIGAPKDEGDARPPHLIDPEDRYRLSRLERRGLGMELSSLAAALASAALVLIDLLPDARLGWSLYAVDSLTLAWLLVMVPLALHGKIKLVLSTLGAAVLVYFFAIDMLDGTITWSAGLGAPIALLSYAVLIITVKVIRSRRIKGINCLGIGAVGLAIHLIGLELILRIASGKATRPYWSIVAALALIPVAILLFYVHSKVLRGANLKKLFRL